MARELTRKVRDLWDRATGFLLLLCIYAVLYMILWAGCHYAKGGEDRGDSPRLGQPK